VPRGGKRPNAGRKKGSATEKTCKIALKAAQAGVTPLEVMLDVMRRFFKGRKYSAAAAIAKDAAPYIHPRLNAITHTGKDGKDLFPAPKVLSREQFNSLTDEERLAYLRGQLAIEVKDASDD
jgi:hypothetical protein